MLTDVLTDFVAHAQTPADPLRVRRSGVLTWPDEDRHTNAYAADPVGYALLALVPGVVPQQRARVLLRILDASWAGLSAGDRAMLSRVARVLTLGLPATACVPVMLALRHRRANHKHVTRAILWLLLEHGQADTLVRTHRAVLVACFEHALGKATARGCARALMVGESTMDLRRSLLRFAPDPAVAAERVRALYAPASSGTGELLAGAPPVREPLDLDLDGGRPAVVTATNRGDIAATLVHLFRGGDSVNLRDAVDRMVGATAETLPAFPGALALVLDQSASMRGYGEREWAVLSQAVALRRVLERRCGRLDVVTVGGPDAPRGPTDLASGVLDALATRPDLVAVVSDGYENTNPGDLARVVATLPRIDVATPVVFCHSTYSHSDDLTLRRPAPAMPQRAFWHQEDFGPLLLWLLLQTRHPDAGHWLRGALIDRLSIVEGAVR
jgi:hypothetical protein